MPRSIRVLTNDKCSFWHFRWDANSDIKMEALTNYMKDGAVDQKVYLINQDYSFGESVRTAAKAMLAAKRPDIQIVGDELHPLLKITDFSPYIAKIKASGADTVITGNWGQDFALLLKAAADAGLKVNWYTYYAGGAGGPTAIKQANLNHQVFQIAEGIANSTIARRGNSRRRCGPKYDFSLFYPRAVNEMRMLAGGRRQGQVARSGQGRSRRSRAWSSTFSMAARASCARTIISSSSRSTSPRSATHRQGAVRRGEYRLGLEAGRQDRHAADHTSDHLQDGPAELMRSSRAVATRSASEDPSGRTRFSTSS